MENAKKDLDLIVINDLSTKILEFVNLQPESLIEKSTALRSTAPPSCAWRRASTDGQPGPLCTCATLRRRISYVSWGPPGWWLPLISECATCGGCAVSLSGSSWWSAATCRLHSPSDASAPGWQEGRTSNARRYARRVRKAQSSSPREIRSSESTALWSSPGRCGACSNTCQRSNGRAWRPFGSCLSPGTPVGSWTCFGLHARGRFLPPRRPQSWMRPSRAGTVGAG